MATLSPKKINRLGILAFVSGFSLMAYELVAARLLAPTIGSSIYVWTSVIGVIIAALSLGYWLGGKVADARGQRIDVVILFLIAAAGVTATILSHPNILSWLPEVIEDVRFQGVVASLLLFAPTSFIFGCMSPYLAKLNIKTLERAGESVANLSALNSIGGITGTFITGFLLFSYIGSNETLIIITLSLVASSWLLVPRKFFMQRLVLSVVLILLSLLPAPMPPNMIARIDTPSAHYDIFKVTYDSQPIYGLATGPGGIQSAVHANGQTDLVFWYTQYAAQLIKSMNPDRVLVLGGGAFTLPGYLAEELPNATIDVVEIDPELEKISKQYFHYKSPANVNLIFEDARTFVNQADSKYDAIFVDVYGDSYVPFSLLTREYGQRVADLVEPDGTIILNAIIGLTGKCSALADAIDTTYRPHYKNAYWMTRTGDAVPRANYILAYTNNPTVPLAMNTLSKRDGATSYNDNFMPAERIHFECQQSRRKG